MVRMRPVVAFCVLLALVSVATAQLEMRLAGEPFDDPLVRKALVVGIPWADLTAELFGDVMPVFIDVDGVVDASQVPYDPDVARELLAEAGFPDGFAFALVAPPELESFVFPIADLMTKLALEAVVVLTEAAGERFAGLARAGATAAWLATGSNALLDEAAERGDLYLFDVSDDEIIITFPTGLESRASLRGQLALLILGDEEGQIPPDGQAPLLIIDIREDIFDVVVPLNGQEVALGTFTLTRDMLDLDESGGEIDVVSGEYQLTYVIRPFHPRLQDIPLGTIVVEEFGRIDFEEGTMDIFGSLTIEDGIFAGTIITYSPKHGSCNGVFCPQ